jgi:DGQHR domain-containing protein
MKAFILSGGDYPSSIILNWVSAENPLTTTKNGHLSFKLGSRLAQQVDGQHRVEGFRAAIKEKPSISKLEIPVAIYQGLSTQECADIFLSINAKQKPVARSLVTDLFAVASAHVVDPGSSRARDIAELLSGEPDSPYFGSVKFPNDPRGRAGIPLSTIVDNLKPIVEHGGLLPSVGLVELNMQYKSIKNFFDVLKMWYGKHWDSRNNPFYYAAGFVGALGFFKQTVIPYCNLDKDFSSRRIADTMDLNPNAIITRDRLKGKQGRASWNEVISLLTERWKAGMQSAEIKL